MARFDGGGVSLDFRGCAMRARPSSSKDCSRAREICAQVTTERNAGGSRVRRSSPLSYLRNSAIVTRQKMRKILHMCDYVDLVMEEGENLLLIRTRSGSEHFFRLPPSRGRNESLSVNVPFNGSIGRRRRRRSDGRTIGFIRRRGGRPKQEGTAAARAPRGYRVRLGGQAHRHRRCCSLFSSNARFS